MDTPKQASNFGIDLLTIESAAEASAGKVNWDPSPQWRRDLYRSRVRAALRVLGPAIREALVREMIADAQGEKPQWLYVSVNPGRVDARCWDSVGIAAALRSYLPAAEEGGAS